ncbi:uncharacterized protein EAE97_005549 [Botrytis byssoidea]|uniref:Uncharacterized protein n=1 Tax=Botrytis byssoidea TaxID=139641 RepID=A0A9P5IQC8_9HELO|nr:uncharacterized protein EAE97_005549 [Botrytis byssoidea]KAF7944916.1 hypothetical protein EAE97_005549 [Botrytis byssoidea]
MAPPAGKDVLGLFIHLNQQVAKAVQLLYLGNDEAFSESLLEQAWNCSLKIERVLAVSNDAQIFENDAPTKSFSMVPMTPVISVYQLDGSVYVRLQFCSSISTNHILMVRITRNDGRDRAACTHIILLAKDEDPMKPLAYQPAMNNNWVRFPWKGLCEKCPVILHLLDHSLLPVKMVSSVLCTIPRIPTSGKLPTTMSVFTLQDSCGPGSPKSWTGYDKVKDLNDWDAFRAVRRIGFRLKGSKNCEKVVEATEKAEIVNMGRSLGMTESSIRDIRNDGTDTDSK